MAETIDTIGMIKKGAEDWNRTSDTRIFSPLLYLSELPRHGIISHSHINSNNCNFTNGKCQGILSGI